MRERVSSGYCGVREMALQLAALPRSYAESLRLSWCNPRLLGFAARPSAAVDGLAAGKTKK